MLVNAFVVSPSFLGSARPVSRVRVCNTLACGSGEPCAVLCGDKHLMADWYYRV